MVFFIEQFGTPCISVIGGNPLVVIFFGNPHRNEIIKNTLTDYRFLFLINVK